MSDLIDRQAATDALRAMQTYKLFAGDDMLLIDQAGAQTELMMLPPAQPERIRGHWIHDGHHIRCDQCREYMCDKDAEGDRIPTNFCPNCGADMREVTT